MKALAVVFVSFVSFSVTGCVGVIAVPPLSNKPVSGKVIPRRDATFIKPGTTTRAEVIRSLGTGYRDSIRVAAIAYPWELPGGKWVSWGMIFVPIANWSSGDASSGDFARWRALFVDFDARGVVTRKEFVRLKPKLTLDEQLEAWAGWVPRNTPPVILP
ncbi:MAG: hypothetical protein RL088_1125 [Verrucomicrobiota bacterium]|jgi:hypothetical protein